MAHGFFNHAGRTPQRDILFYTELGRQASLAISHAFLQVGVDDVFIFEGSEATLTDAAWSSARTSSREPVRIDIRIRELTRRKTVVNRVVAEHRMSIGGNPVFQGTGAWSVQPVALFRRLRRISADASRSTTAPADADARSFACVAREPATNVVISAPACEEATMTFLTSLVVDDAPPYFFDHPCDHVPGMLLLEGCAQLAVAACGATTGAPRHALAVRSYDVNFTQFAECGVPTVLSARVEADQTVQVSISQQDVVCGTTRMTVAIPA
jgi:3-hydroxymyristoyl/3-hydroxydecanoyl-(acyl carrier protein) dehydratase